MAHYVPATFDLHEFDDASHASPARRAIRRWFSGFNGRIGSPPQNVTLGWSDGDATVLVCTDGRRPFDEADARTSAAHVALGGNELALPRRPGSATDTAAEMTQIASADDLWSQTPGVLPGAPAAHTAAWDDFALGYILLSHGAIFIAAVPLKPQQFKIRKVRDWSAYDVDASKSHPLSELRR